MQRLFLCFFTLIALYVSGFACATEEPILSQSFSPAGERPTTHIALMLPLNAELFAPAAEIVRQGFLAAARTQPHVLPIRIYSSVDESQEVVSLYRQAIANGALAVVGPLTRNGVSTLALEKNIPVPTLALNLIEEQSAGPLYFFGMGAEAEARQAAQQAWQRGFQHAMCISSSAQLSQRLLFAFEDEWLKLSGGSLSEVEFNGDPAPLLDLKANENSMVFLAVDATKAQLIRPYLPSKLPVYATSQVFFGDNETLINYELDGINFVDMPWLLQADHPAVMIYPRMDPPLAPDQERLYALGIDAFRLIQLMLNDQVHNAMPLDGVTGRINLYGYTFERKSIPAIFEQGRASLPGRSVTPSPRAFPSLSSAPAKISNP